MDEIEIDGARLWVSLMAMAEIGATAKGGSRRLAGSDEDAAGRECFARWCREAGMSVRFDAVGNLIARREGRDPALTPVAIGSHLDTQPTGGRFDGVYGVLAGLEVVRALNAAGHATRHPLELFAWTNEEGARFSPPMMGSGAFAGVFTREHILEQRDSDGVRLGDELARHGHLGEGLGHPLAAYLEAHIEQGPVLVDGGQTIGVVAGAQGQRWYEVTVRGQEAHAGPTPMRLRRDALGGAAEMIQAVHGLALDTDDDACATVGQIRVHPASRNVIPGEAWFSVDLRHPDADTLAAMDQRLRERLAAITDRRGLELAIADFWAFPTTRFAPELVERVRAAAARRGYAHRDLVSGAGHDAVYLARVAPTAMVFIPCEGGISHNEVENIRPEDAAAGCAVLLDVVLETADQ